MTNVLSSFENFDKGCKQFYFEWLKKNRDFVLKYIVLNVVYLL